MSRRRVVVVTTLPVLVLVAVVAVCAGAPARAGEGDDDPGAVAVLQRAVLAAGTVAFTGVQLVGTATAGGSSTRMLDVRADGHGRRWAGVRVGGAPAATGRVWTASPPAEPSVDPLTLLAGAYRLDTAPTEQVAGRPADVVVASRAGVRAARLWVDVETGLLLREEVFDGDGALTRRSTFVSLTVSPRTVVAVAAGAAGSSSSVRRVDPAAIAVLDKESAPCPRTLPGGFALLDARASASADAVHLTYSDGLSGLSLFVQAGRLGPMPTTAVLDWSGAQVHLARSWPAMLVWQGGGNVYTLVSDAPPDEQRAVVEALPHDRGAGTLVDRVEQGLRTALARL